MIFKLLVIFMIVIFIMLVGAFFATPEFSMPCSEKLLTCLESVYHKPFWEKMSGGLSCVGSNVVCMGGQFKGIF